MKDCPHCIDSKSKGLQCLAEFNKSIIKLETIRNNILVSTLTRKKFERIWVCPKCNNESLISQTRKIQTVLKEPSFLQVIPSAPTRRDGILDRREYHKKFTIWATLFMNELSYQMSRYRLEYKPKDMELDQEEIKYDGQEMLDDF